MQLSPLQEAKERFGGADEADRKEARKIAKEELIKAVKVYAKRGDLLEDDFSDKGIERVSIKKLLKLHNLAEKVEKEFGSRQGIIDAVLELESRTKDEGYREHFEGYPLPKLYDYYHIARKRS